MLTLVLLSFSVTLVQGFRGVENNKAYKPFIGVYYYTYAWPKSIERTIPIPSCDRVIFKKLKYNFAFPLKCVCDRNLTNIALLNQYSRATNKSTTLLIQVANDYMQSVMGDFNCACHPDLKFKKVVLRKLYNNCIMYYERFGNKYTYLLCPTVLSDKALTGLIKTMREVERVEGKKLCPGEEAPIVIDDLLRQANQKFSYLRDKIQVLYGRKRRELRWFEM